MKKLAFGYLLAFELIPRSMFTGFASILLYLQVVGVALVYLGMREMSEAEHNIKEVTDLTLLLAIVWFLIISIDIFNPALLSSMLMTMLRILVVLAFFFVTYKFQLGLAGMEKQHNANLHADKVFLALLYVAVLHVLSLVFVFHPIQIITVVGYLVAKIIFIIRVFLVIPLVEKLS